MSWLKFDNQEKGYKPLKLNAESIKRYEGCRFVYVLSKDTDRYRGTAIPRFATIGKKRYSYLFINEYEDSIDLRDVLEAGIHIEDAEAVDSKQKTKQ